MTRFQLTGPLLTGHAVIDIEHEQIVVFYNEFVDQVEAGNENRFSNKITEITKALYDHIESEEKIMAELGCWHLETHKKEHIAAKRRWARLISDADRNGFGGDFLRGLASILLDDLIKADMEF